MIKKRTVILDTNVLLHDPESPRRFGSDQVIIPIQVIEEVDRFKKDPGEKGRNARRVSRLLDSFRAKGNLADGVQISRGEESTLKVAFCRKETTDRLPPELKGDSGDNKILAVALEQQNKQMLGDESEVVFISKDTNLRIPGPVPLPQETLDLMSRQMINHRGPEYADMLDQMTKNLQTVLMTKSDVYFVTASGTGGMETAIVNTTSPGDKVLSISIGWFGERFAEIYEAYGCETIKISFDFEICKSLKFFNFLLILSRLNFLSICLKYFCKIAIPTLKNSSCDFCLINFLIPALALPVFTKFSHSGLGVEFFDLSIST